MYIDKKNYWLRLPLIDKFLKRLILKNRIKIYRIFEENTNFDENTNIIDVGTTPILEEHENIIFHHYKWKKNITGFSNQDCSILKKVFKESNFILGDARDIKLKDNSFDISFCSATIEHIGSYLNQKKLISELIRISKNNIFITTPNRNFPMDFHTKLPLVHLLPKSIHRKILSFFGLKYFAEEKNLNLLNTNEIKQICSELNIKNYKILYNKFLFLKSNIILIIKK
tara:strand:- start:331 stop:1011 length:681 start_codon:yes stop_codon:yes gene_type:complete